MDEAGFPQTVVALLEGYAEAVSPEQTAPMSISIPDLKVVRTAIGVLLNASVNYGAYFICLFKIKLYLTNVPQLP